MLIRPLANLRRITVYWCLLVASPLTFAWEPVEPISGLQDSMFRRFCEYPVSGWYKTYFETISAERFDDYAKKEFPGYPTKEFIEDARDRYSKVSAILSRSDENRALLILGLEQFVYSAHLLASNGNTDRLAADILLQKAITNINRASNNGDFAARTFRTFWEFIGLSSTPSIQDTLNELTSLAKEGSQFANKLLIDHQEKRSWPFLLELTKTRRLVKNLSHAEKTYPRRGNYSCDNIELASPPSWLLTPNKYEPYSGHSGYERIHWNYWAPLKEGTLSFKSKQLGLTVSANSACIHLLNTIENGEAPLRAFSAYLQYCPNRSDILLGHAEKLIKSGDPNILDQLAISYLTNKTDADDALAIQLLELNKDSQPIKSREALMTAYSVNKPDPAKCLAIKDEMSPFETDMSFASQEYGYEENIEAYAWTNIEEDRNGNRFATSMNWLQFVGKPDCYDPFIFINRKKHRLENNGRGVRFDLFYDPEELTAEDEFQNFKGFTYWPELDYNLRRTGEITKVAVTESYYIGTD